MKEREKEMSIANGSHYTVDLIIFFFPLDIATYPTLEITDIFLLCVYIHNAHVIIYLCGLACVVDALFKEGLWQCPGGSLICLPV